jgi:sigma-B regulation protein RsbU (phosphoserine phosphatase)
MLYRRRPWEEELAIIDRVMKSVSDITEPEEMVGAYWNGISELIPAEDYLALSTRGIEPPQFLITRSSRFDESINPWESRHRLPKLSGGILGEIAYADRPVIIDDLPRRLTGDDPGFRYLDGFQSLFAFPQYEGGRGINVGITLFPPGVEVDRTSIPILHWQASLFGRGTQSLVLRKQLTRALQDLDRELRVVGEIQRSLLPSRPPRIDGFDIATSYTTSTQAGGDYYDFFPLGSTDNRGDGWGLFIADVSGHGTPAAVLMAITHAIARTRPGTPVPAGSLLHYINGHLARSYANNGTFVTAFYATLDTATRQLSFAVAGHNPPLVLRGSRTIALEGDAGLPLGLAEHEEYREANFLMEPGDLLVLYTDGVTEAMAPPDASGQRELFGDTRLVESLRAGALDDVHACVRRVEDAVRVFTHDAPPTDDRTLVVVRCT